MKPIFALILAVSLISFCAQAETHVPAGPVSGIWTLAGSPYIIEGSIVVEFNASLMIQPGVQVIMNHGRRFRIEGQLQALGTQDDSIRFLAADTALGSEGLHFYNTDISPQDSSVLDYCVVSYGVASPPPDPYRHGGGIYILFSSRLRISHCYIHHCRTLDVVGTNGQNGGPGQAGGAGGNAQAGNGGAIYCEASNPIICFNNVSYNATGQGWGGNGGNGGGANGYGAIGGQGGDGTGGHGGAIYLRNSNLSLADNVMSNNINGAGHGGVGGHGGYAGGAWLFLIGGNGGIGGIGRSGCGPAIYSDFSQVIIRNNIVYENHLGNGYGGTGGHGGDTGEIWEYGQGGNGGNGGIGYGGNGLALFITPGSSTTLINCTLTRHYPISLGQGGNGGTGGYSQGGNGNYGNPGQSINGVAIIYGNGLTVMNSIIWDNADPYISAGNTITYSCIQSGFPGQGNISTDPLFIAGPNGAYYLSQVAAGQSVNSPCLDAGDPASPMIIGTTRTDQIQDAGIVDMGYHYPIITSVPILDITLTPLHPPLIIPANGGNFSFNFSMLRHVGPQAPYSVWCRIKNPDGSYTNPTLGPVTINTPVGATVTRRRSQSVPGTWAAGQYSYLGYVNTTYSYPAIDSSTFTFTKSTVADGEQWIMEAICTGESIASDAENQLITHNSALITSLTPNPFNPTTDISYQLALSTPVHLTVHDVQGRLVATLVDGWREAGMHEVTFDGSKLASGLYFVRMEAGEFTGVQKIVLMK